LNDKTAKALCVGTKNKGEPIQLFMGKSVFAQILQSNKKIYSLIPPNNFFGLVFGNRFKINDFFPSKFHRPSLLNYNLMWKNSE
jgi:hypothetical protein